jgi:hypothetical protein
MEEAKRGDNRRVGVGVNFRWIMTCCEGLSTADAASAAASEQSNRGAWRSA